MEYSIHITYLRQLRANIQWNMDNLSLSESRKIRDEAKLELLDSLIGYAREG